MARIFSENRSQNTREATRTSRQEQTINQMKNKLLENITVTPAKCAILHRYRRTVSPSFPAEVKWNHHHRAEISQIEVEEIKTRLREFADRVNNGEKFSTLAVLYSDDTGLCQEREANSVFTEKGKLMLNLPMWHSV